ncbi:hypothetical protein FDUTEX481_05005 [Tolypothrix sp. PCC 7601]|nr:hypothetical protein FDUTEX481_05005 [Tolypothrix sp. PCC 7601]
MRERKENHKHQLPITNYQLPMPNAQCPMPNAQCPLPITLVTNQ